MSKPVAGQWYDYRHLRMRCVAVSKQNDVVFEHRNGSFEFFRDGDEPLDELTHLPDCTGWEWEPETFPQYYKAVQDAAFVRRDSPTQSVAVWRSGAEEFMPSPFDPKRYTQRLTEQQALALLDKPVEVKQEPPASDFASSLDLVATTICKDDDLAWMWHCQIAMAIKDQIGSKLSHAEAHHCAARAMKMLFGADVEKTEHWNITVKPQPAEDPEEWVVQDRVPYRPMIDQYRWRFSPVSSSDWYEKREFKHSHGYVDAAGHTFEVRCRRKDLPAKKRTVTVPKWLVVYSDGKVGVYETDAKPRVDSVHKEVHRVGETTYEIEEA